MKPKRTLLAIDTATKTAAAAVLDFDEESVLSEKSAPAETHGKALVPLIQATFEEAGVEPRSLVGVGCGAGPGSFTGVRVGLATAKGICLPANLPLALISSLDGVACRIQETGNKPKSAGVASIRNSCPLLVAPCMDARRGEVFFSLFAADTPYKLLSLLDPCAASPAQAIRILSTWVQNTENLKAHSLDSLSSVKIHIIGTGLSMLENEIEKNTVNGEGVFVSCQVDPWPSAAAIGIMALRKIKENRSDDLAAAQPIYLRPSDAEQKFNVDLSPQK